MVWIAEVQISIEVFGNLPCPPPPFSYAMVGEVLSNTVSLAAHGTKLVYSCGSD